MKRFFAVLCTVACLLSPALAQEGHPLVGTWQGEWGAAGGNGNFLTVIMYWDGRNITGIVNPGPGSTTIGIAQLDSSAWTVHLEMDLQDAAGTTVHFVGDGQLENIGSQLRSLKGTWRHGTGSGTFTLTRQSGA
jgi:hypothetical protein